MKPAKQSRRKKPAGPGFHGVAKRVLKNARDNEGVSGPGPGGKAAFRSVFISDFHRIGLDFLR